MQALAEFSDVSAGAAPGVCMLSGAPLPVATSHGEFLTFRLGAEEYAIDILQVQEIRSYEPPTRIANAPHYIKGVVNLRGAIVPIVDLRLQLGCETVQYDALTVVIVLSVRGHVVGAVVDSVSDVVALGPDQIKPAPAVNAVASASHITGIGSIQADESRNDARRMLILLDIVSMMGDLNLGRA